MGLAITQALARLGATVYAADIVSQAPTGLADLKSVHFSGGVDVTSRDSCHKLVSSIPGRLDGLVNCAGICPHEGKIASDGLFAKIMAVNTTGTWNMGTEAILRMSEQESGTGSGLLPDTERSLPSGSIINIASGAGLRGIAGVPAYCASKHAVVGLTRAWARDWPTIRINSVAPGMLFQVLFC
jgi:NAD(P)-dependent dehydrogenase (short-subunit alcohol dehydrogenase family)